jgi:hypothetical protein
MSQTKQLKLGAFMRPVSIHTEAWATLRENLGLKRPRNRFFPD